MCKLGTSNSLFVFFSVVCIEVPPYPQFCFPQLQLPATNNDLEAYGPPDALSEGQ